MGCLTINATLRDILYIFIFNVRHGKRFMMFHKSENVKNVPFLRVEWYDQ